MQQKLEKLKRISSVIRVTIWIVLMLGLIYSGYGLATSGDYRAVYDENLNLLWEAGEVHKFWLLLNLLPTLVFFMTFAWYFQYLLKLFSQGTFFSEQVIFSFKMMLWSKVIGFFTPIIQAIVYAWMARDLTEKVAASVKFNLWHVFTIVVLFTIFYLLNGAHQIEKENQEFI